VRDSFIMPRKGGAVHVAKIVTRRKGREYVSYLLRRGYRDGATVRHENLGNISHLPPRLIDAVRRGLAGEEILFASEALTTTRSLPHGQVEAVLGTIRRLGLDSIIASRPSRERALILALIAGRLIRPSSKLASASVWRSTTLAEELGVEDATVDEIYSALDWLLSRKKRIETKLARRHLAEGSLALYDVSSSYYEGHHCALAQFGYSRDGKRGLPVVVYGVMTDRDGRPVGVDVYKGNTGDPSTVPGAVEKLRTQFGLERVVLVGDRGLLVQTRIETLKQYPGLGWISALRSQAIQALVVNGCLTPSSLSADTMLAEISSPDYPGERLIACFNPALAIERGRKREELVAVTEEALKKLEAEVSRRTKTPLEAKAIALKLGRLLEGSKVAKHFETTIEEGRFRYERNEASIAREVEVDGIYILRTSESAEAFSSAEVVRSYKSLAQVERVFRALKSVDLLVRPIRHWTEAHVRAHIFLCVLSYYVQWEMMKHLAPLLYADEQVVEARASRDPIAPARPSASARRKKAKRVREDGLEVHTFSTLMMELATRCRTTYEVGSGEAKQSFQQLTAMTPLQAEAFRLLGL
jgi:hypothetical protein